MKVKNLNSSSRKTKKAIKLAFAELIKEKQNLSSITVTELVKKADITRSSFYTHYDNIYDVAGDIQDETMQILLSDTEHIKSVEDFDNYIDKITVYLKENEDIYSLILSSDETIIFADRLVRLLSKKLDMTFDSNLKNVKLNIIFYTYGSIIIVIKYFRKQIDCSLDDINLFMKKAIRQLFEV